MRNYGTFRVTRHINRQPAVNLHHATRYCEMIGLPLNRMVTVNFALTGCNDNHESLTFRKMLTQRFAPWLRRSAPNALGVAPTYVWTMEAGGRQLAVHWLVHVPKGCARGFEQKIVDWVASLTGGSPDAGAIKVQPIYSLIGLRRYILKGIHPAWASHLGVRHEDQGIVIGKRSGFSRNLGPCARKRGGYRPRRRPFASAAE